MRQAYDVAQVRHAEQRLMDRLPDGALMQRAAAGLARVCVRVLGGRVYGTRVVLLVGSGDNGGDALFAGARLAGRGARVDALLLGDRHHEAGLAALVRAGGRVVHDHVAREAELVVDGITGIGGRGGLRGRAAAVVADLATDAPVVAVDVPSGVDADTGQVPGPAVRADVTVTFGTYKPGLLVDPGAGHAGVVELVDIGLDLPGDAPVEALQAQDVTRLLPRAGRESDKYRRGVVGVAAGSDEYTGAAVLCAGGALRGGAGMVRYVGADAPTALVRARWPEVVVGEGRVQAWTVGSGGGGDAAGRLAAAADAGVPLVVDADALAVLRDGPRLRVPSLLTPHAGELARLLDVDRADVEARRLEHARRAAAELGAVVLLKGSTTVVAGPDARVRVNPTGSAALATAGSGDVLAGLCGALLAGGLDPYDAGAVGAWLH
ncbi:MAG: NAD(P)H-hydrate dehydratase, partial [Actinomycetes bacterium]